MQQNIRHLPLTIQKQMSVIKMINIHRRDCRWRKSIFYNINKCIGLIETSFIRSFRRKHLKPQILLFNYFFIWLKYLSLFCWFRITIYLSLTYNTKPFDILLTTSFIHFHVKCIISEAVYHIGQLLLRHACGCRTN